MKLVILSVLFAVSMAAEVGVSLHGGAYNYNFATGDAGGHRRQESGSADGSVAGSYSYVDPNGDLRTVSYTAGPHTGFQASGDTGVDRKTAAEAAALNALAPKALGGDATHHPYYNNPLWNVQHHYSNPLWNVQHHYSNPLWNAQHHYGNWWAPYYYNHNGAYAAHW